MEASGIIGELGMACEHGPKRNEITFAFLNISEELV